MKLTPELYVLTLTIVMTALMWLPYMLARMATRGLANTFANPGNPAFAPDPAWAQRARRAHANAIENLVLFAPLVIVLAVTGAGTAITLLAAETYLVARLAHYLVYAAGIPVLRTLAFTAGFAATLVIAAAILGHA